MSKLERDVYLYTEIEPKTTEPLIKQLRAIAQEDLKTSQEIAASGGQYQPEPIKLHINSPGGSLPDTLAIVHVIKSMKTPIHTYVDSLAASGAFILACIGVKRFAYKYSELMYHEAAYHSGWMFLEEQKEYVKYVQRLQQFLDEIVIEHTKITKEQMESCKEKKQDWYMFVKEAKKLGVIDVIL